LFQVTWNIFLVYYLFFSICNLCSQVENSLTAQVGEPRGAARGEPALAGSDVPLPEDGFIQEVEYLYLPYFEVAAYLMLFLFRLWIMINAYFFQRVH
jgi:hypothetical protein